VEILKELSNMADITFKEYLEGRSKEEMMKNRQKLMDDYKEFLRRQKVMEQKTMAKAGKMMSRLTGGQAKLDKNKNNRIDAQDFKILRAEKAKGRGQGLQDEKMKPGKVMKASMGRGIGSVAGKSAREQAPEKRRDKRKKRDPMTPEQKMRQRLAPTQMMGGGMTMTKPEQMSYYGGGMMQRPNPMRAKGGVMVKVKLGRNKPTKTY
tara:strand:+ start:434 stop:1054 length:621 start_codon:yes stop_codon:yes gene_type:complete